LESAFAVVVSGSVPFGGACIDGLSGLGKLVELFHGGVVEEVGVGGELHGGVLDLGDFNLRGTLDNA
jgi:hypothetical protein